MSEFTSIQTLFFSPTGTTKKIARAIARGVAAPTRETSESSVREIDLTHEENPAARIDGRTVTILAAPVYGGHVAPTASRRMEGIHGAGGPAVVVVVYGNRAFEHAAGELAELARRQGFNPIAAAAFVGEHSYSTPSTPIAAGRPDAADLAAAEAFGQSVRRKIDRGTPAPVDASRLKERSTPLVPMLRFIAFAIRYMIRQRRHPDIAVPEGDPASCTHCGRCAAICPVQAIPRGDETRTDPSRCIRCCACVKGCPVGARTFHTPFAAALARNFSRRKEPVTLL
ncbi:4Fe-4S binding protein [Alistipes sp.]|uniref:4Fe-4S binding protein n=1 Tax=Alistipes sp. TaxID=1872444 RepID=UPI003A83FA6C